MLQLILFTVLFVGPAFATMLSILHILRLVLPAGRALYDPIEPYLIGPAILLALSLAGIVASLQK